MDDPKITLSISDLNALIEANVAAAMANVAAQRAANARSLVEKQIAEQNPSPNQPSESDGA